MVNVCNDIIVSEVSAKDQYISSSVFNYYRKTWAGGGWGVCGNVDSRSLFCYWRHLHYQNLPSIIGSFNLVAEGENLIIQKFLIRPWNITCSIFEEIRAVR